jgi:hypothetical protein
MLEREGGICYRRLVVEVEKTVEAASARDKRVRDMTLVA